MTLINLIDEEAVLLASFNLSISDEKLSYTEGDIRVWWIPQVPMEAIRFVVPDIVTALLVCKVLETYDWFQYHNNIKPSFTNAGGIEVYDGESWMEAEDNEGESVY